MLKSENDALRDDVAAGRRRVWHIKAVCQSVWPPRPPAWIMQPPPDWQTPLNGIISPSERGPIMQNKSANPSILMSSADRVAHIDGQLMQLL